MHILIVEDIPILSETVFRPLAARAHPGATLETARDAQSLRRLIDSGRRFDLVLLGLYVAGTRRALDMSLLAKACTRLGERVVVHSADADPGIVRFAKQAGAFAYLRLDCPFDEFAANLLLVLEGSRLFPPHQPVPIHLTARQLEVLSLLSEGTSDKGIAKLLGVSVHTVIKHMRQLRETFNVSNRTALVLHFRDLYAPGYAHPG